MCNRKDGLLKQFICCRNMGKARTAIGEKFVLHREREREREREKELMSWQRAMQFRS